ncbi:MAG: 3-oxoadipyl-CoA thiolase [Bacteroidia bacterium]|nr:3-oxoadipyl-CoA thiolase [Bacteroidia bacterium]MDW8159478.1 3-oxoadipyl-CoA thiolase [Bacteroidia bacterium]
MQQVYILDACRTAIGSYGGILSSARPDDLLAHTLKALLERNPTVDVNEIEEVFAGAANQSGEDNRNVARMSLLLAGFPVEVAGVTVNRLCASGLEAVVCAYRAIKCGDGNLYIAGGVESMSRAPFVVAKAYTAFSRNAEMYDTTIGWRFTNPRLAQQYPPYSMGETAENVAERWKISREAQDIFALGSQQKYAAAFEKGHFEREIVPYPITHKKGETTWVKKDEHPRPDTTLEKLAQLKPAFKPGGTVTAGNSSGINDGAAALLLASENYVKKHSFQPLARIVACASAGVDPAIMGIGPVPATQKVLKRAGLELSDIGLVELNEAFAAQSIACIQELGLNPEIVNVNGGAIALGHPLGCSGARILTTLLYEMQRRQVQYGLATLCIGVGQGLAMIVERC